MVHVLGIKPHEQHRAARAIHGSSESILDERLRGVWKDRSRIVPASPSILGVAHSLATGHKAEQPQLEFPSRTFREVNTAQQ